MAVIVLVAFTIIVMTGRGNAKIPGGNEYAQAKIDGHDFAVVDLEKPPSVDNIENPTPTTQPVVEVPPAPADKLVSPAFIASTSSVDVTRDTALVANRTTPPATATLPVNNVPTGVEPKPILNPAMVQYTSKHPFELVSKGAGKRKGFLPFGAEPDLFR